MYSDSPEKAAYDEAGQSEAGSLKASLMCNKTEMAELSQGKVLQIQRQNLRLHALDKFTRVKPDTFSLHLCGSLIF